jgi:hypothetical protein
MTRRGLASRSTPALAVRSAVQRGVGALIVPARDDATVCSATANRVYGIAMEINAATVRWAHLARCVGAYEASSRPALPSAALANRREYTLGMDAHRRSEDIA